MAKADDMARIRAARDVARELSALLRRDSLRRLRLFHEYSHDADARWTPDFQRRCKLAEVLCSRLDELLGAGEETKPLCTGKNGMDEPGTPALTATQPG